MTARTVRRGRLRGRVTAPPSKSYTHRALVAGYLSGRRFWVDSPLDSDDTRATARALRRLGASISPSARGWIIVPPARTESSRPIEIDCGESGTTLRLSTALAALGRRPTRFRGHGRLSLRPMRPLIKALTELGADVRPGRGNVLLTVTGPIHGGRVRLDASESSQFATALLLVLPTLAEDSRILLEGRIVSEPYLEATTAILRRLGVVAERRGREFRIPGGQRYAGRRFRVPGDASSAAYFWVGAAISGGSVAVAGVTREWPQADLAVLDLLVRAGADVRERRSSILVRSGRPRPFTLDLTTCPDLYPLAGVLAATIPGTSRLRGGSHVVRKESNRRTGTVRLAAAFGARAREVGGGVTIEGRPCLRAVSLPHLSDHRVVMSAAVGALAASGPSLIGEAEAVRKSYPGFWSALRQLGAEVGPR